MLYGRMCAQVVTPISIVKNLTCFKVTSLRKEETILVSAEALDSGDPEHVQPGDPACL